MNFLVVLSMKIEIAWNSKTDEQKKSKGIRNTTTKTKKKRKNEKQNNY